tara:strand:- start:28 stop:198 length:171 start_codon:yes stop_codon:yes gene_type:complete
MAAFYLKKFAEFVLGTYTFDSGFFDGEAGTTEDSYLWERCEDNPEVQWLVLVDLHN